MMLSHTTPPQGTIRDWIDAQAKAQPDAQAFLFTDPHESPLTWTDLQNSVRHLAEGITAKGITQGESVAIMMPNGRDVVLAFFAVVYGGFRAAMINLLAGQSGIQYALDHCDATYAFVGSEQLDEFNAAKPKHMQVIDMAQTETAPLHDISSDTDALLMYTSGTTGKPKGVVHTQASLLAGGWTTAIAHQLTQADRGLCVLPMCHINGLCVTVISTLISGGSLVMAPRFSNSNFWAWADAYNITWFSIVPTIVSHLLHGKHEPTEPTKHRVRFGRSASAPLAPEVQNAFEARFGMPIIETMGLTETAAQILSNPLPPLPRKIGSPGIPFGNQVAILRPDRTNTPQGEEGEIAIKGPNVLSQYLKNPEATKATFTQDGWLLTGDLGRIDKDGYVFVTGRSKELIIKGGENIAPREIDEALFMHPDVVEAAAFACPCPSYGERVEAAVSLCDNSQVSAEELIVLCRTQIGKFKSPDTVHILPELPKGPSGKVQRLKLADFLNKSLSES